MMTMFDNPVPASTIGRRSRSNVPAQALMMMNDPFVIEQARHWARCVLGNARLTPSERVELMHRQAYARAPMPSELRRCLDFVQQQAADRNIGDWEQSQAAWTDLAHVLLNTKEFMFIP